MKLAAINWKSDEMGALLVLDRGSFILGWALASSIMELPFLQPASLY